MTSRMHSSAPKKKHRAGPSLPDPVRGRGPVSATEARRLAGNPAGTTVAPLQLQSAEGLAGVGEQTWIEVIRKMDEVYNDLLQYEVALEEKNDELETSQHFIYSVLGSMSDILVVCNRAGVIETVNNALLQFTKRPASDLIGTVLFDLFALDTDREKVRRSLKNPQVTPLRDCEIPLRDVAGEVLPFSMNCTPRLNSRGMPVGMVFIGRPVGELKRAYHALREAHDDLKRTQQQLLHAEKMASLGRLVAGVAHELNNPISFVLGNVHTLQRYADRLQRYLSFLHGQVDQPQASPLYQELRMERLLQDLPSLIEGMVEGAERTRDIVDSLKRFSAVDRNEMVPLEVEVVVQRAVHWVTKTASEHFKVTTRIPAGLRVKGSQGQLQQVFMNLIQNAQDATAAATQPALHISAERLPHAVILRFHDNGPGIATEHLPHLFEPFFTTKPVGKGTGLGLSISYGIAERHGGGLSAYNHVQGGAVFELALPLCSEHQT